MSKKTDLRLELLELQIQFLILQGKTIMHTITEFADKMKAHQDAMDKAILGLQGDVKGLNDTITALTASLGEVPPEAKALLDAVEQRAANIHDKLDALDALTPPVPEPPAPVPPAPEPEPKSHGHGHGHKK